MVKNLKYLREKNGWSQEKLAEKLGTVQQSVGKYETTKTEPDISGLIELAHLFDTSVDFLIGATDVEKRYEKVTRYDLNADEVKIMEKYRGASDYGKKAANSILDAFEETKEDKEP